MGRPAKPSVRFTYAKRKTFPFQTIRLCLTYKGKRLFNSDEGRIWDTLDLSKFNSDGTLNFASGEKIPQEYIDAAKDLQHTAELAVMIAYEAERRGVWEILTSKDLGDLFGYMSEHCVTLQYLKRDGRLDEPGRIAEALYEHRWKRVGKAGR